MIIFFFYKTHMINHFKYIATRIYTREYIVIYYYTKYIILYISEALLSWKNPTWAANMIYQRFLVFLYLNGVKLNGIRFKSSSSSCPPCERQASIMLASTTRSRSLTSCMFPDVTVVTNCPRPEALTNSLYFWIRGCLPHPWKQHESHSCKTCTWARFGSRDARV